jgi:hypothetical protein
MKVKLSLLVMAAALMAGTPVVASYKDVTPYIGMDAKWYRMPFKKGFGDNLAESNYPQINGFVGVKLNEFFGVEAGYEVSANKTRDALVNDGDTYFSVVIPAGFDEFKTVTETKISGFNVNFVGFMPISEEHALDLIGAVGLAHLKLRIIHSVPAHDVRTEFSKEKWVPKLSLGLQHMLAKQFGVRATVGWQKTSRLGDVIPAVQPSAEIAKVKDSTSVGFGLFYNFK